MGTEENKEEIQTTEIHEDEGEEKDQAAVGASVESEVSTVNDEEDPAEEKSKEEAPDEEEPEEAPTEEERHTT